MFKTTKSALADKCGSFATMFALSVLGLVFIAGVAVDLSRMQSTKVQAQDQLDSALLAAARSMSDSLATQYDGHSLDEARRLKQATQVAKEHLAVFEAQTGYKLSLTGLKLDGDGLTATARTKSTPYFANLLGVKTMKVEVVSATTLAAQEAEDVDVVLIADATGSMQTTLTAIQDNMKRFTRDLSNELNTTGIKLGQVRVQFIFYRDYMADIHKDWTGPRMNLLPGLEGKGPMYISPFFNVPGDRNKMDRYVDYFTADGGGSFRESGLEAVWHALNTDWKSGETTVRSIVLWTDAQTRPLGDKVEWAMDNTTGPDFYFNDAYWQANMSNAFAAMSKEQRQNFAYNTFYPKDMPGTKSGIKSKFAQFHAANSNKMPGVKTMAINVVSNCWDINPCTNWPELATWDGVDLTIDPNGIASGETYKRIVKQVAATVVSQVTAKDIAITH